MLGNDFKMAIATLRGLKWRSILTVLSVVIGVVSITTIIGLGASVKRQIGTQSNRAGQDLITIRPGQPFKRGDGGGEVNLTYGLGFGAGSLSEQDLKTVKATSGVGKTSALNFIAGSAKTDEREYLDGYIFGAEENFGSLINQNMEYGSFFNSIDSTRHLAVIGRTVAEQLFEENVPIGRTLTIRGQNFVVKGVFEPFQPNTLVLGSDFNKAIFIPYLISREISAGSNQIVQILAKPDQPSQLGSVADEIRDNLRKAHFGQNDLSVLGQSETLAASNKVINKVMAFVVGVAAIALLASGIGIMNIMLLSVTERTREIGIRKAIGATNRQLLRLFWFEALVLSVAGALLGILGSVLANYFLHVFTNLKPVVAWWALAAACGISISIGMIFGIIPAVKASRKDPIEALRHET